MSDHNHDDDVICDYCANPTYPCCGDVYECYYCDSEICVLRFYL